MQFSVERVQETKSLIPFQKNIRAFEVKNTVSLKEERNLDGAWKEKNPESAVIIGHGKKMLFVRCQPNILYNAMMKPLSSYAYR